MQIPQLFFDLVGIGLDPFKIEQDKERLPVDQPFAEMHLHPFFFKVGKRFFKVGRRLKDFKLAGELIFEIRADEKIINAVLRDHFPRF